MTQITPIEMFDKINSLISNQQIDDALVLAEQVIADYPDEAEGYFLCSEVYAAKKMDARSVGSLKRASELNPDSIKYLGKLADKLFNLGHLSDAVVFYQRVLAIEPVGWAYIGLGNIYERKGEVTECINYFKLALELSDDPFNLLLRLIKLHKSQGNLDGLIECLKKLIPIATDEKIKYESLCNLGRSYHLLSKFPEAIQQYQQAAKLCPDNAMAYIGLADAYHFSGELDDEVGVLENANEMLNENLEIKSRLAKLLNKDAADSDSPYLKAQLDTAAGATENDLLGVCLLSNDITGKIDKNKYYGHIDAFTEHEISGWVIKGDGTTSGITLEVVINGRVVAASNSHYPKMDISLLLKKPNSKPGFKILLDTSDVAKIDLDEDSYNLEIRIKGTSCYLPLPKTEVSIKKLVKSLKIQSQKPILGTNCRVAFESLENVNTMPKTDNTVKLIAYYLPQFHPILENDEWWGSGFTEWTNVAQALPYFRDHYQPHIPSELGYYDLRLPEVREAQANLAKEYGIYGFCYYYYWFAGRRLLERPLQEVFESGKPDFPFCICWANENWSRRWDGSENDILVQQIHNEKTDKEFILDVIPLFKDPRYIKVNDAPLLIIYRISLMPNPGQTAQAWREICAENGIPEIHLCMAETFGLTEPRQFGFNSSVQFPPHNMVAGLENDKIDDLAEGYTGNIYDFENVIKDQLAREHPVYKQFPGVMTSWDNTARKKKAGNVFINSTPETYEIWLRGAIDRAKQTLPEGEQLVFINAWNEWAEGTHLEPDKKNGRGYLEATRRAITGHSNWKLMLDYAEQLPELAGETKKNFLADIKFALDRLSKVNERLLGVMGDNGLPKYWTTMKKGLPDGWSGRWLSQGGVGQLDSLNHYSNFNGQRVGVDSSQKLWVCGWAYHDIEQVLKNDTPTYLILADIESNATYFALVLQRLERQDVASYHSSENVRFSGIKALADISAVPKGGYHLGVACRTSKNVVLTLFNVEVEIV